MNANELERLDKALDAILSKEEEKRVKATMRRTFKKQEESFQGAYGNAAMLAHANTCTGRANALDYLNTPDELPYQEIERATRRMSFELAE